MIFRGFRRELGAEINSWGLPDHVKRSMLSALMPLVDSPADVTGNADGLYFACNVNDGASKRHYYFEFHLSFEGDDLWADYVDAWIYDGDDRLIWTNRDDESGDEFLGGPH